MTQVVTVGPVVTIGPPMQFVVVTAAQKLQTYGFETDPLTTLAST